MGLEYPKQTPEAKITDKREYREKFFENLERDTRLFSNSDYEKVFALHKKSWGINSPACGLYKNSYLLHPHPEVLPGNIKKVLVAINRDSVDDPEFIEYLKTHEYWELFIAEKEGFNLKERTQADYKLPVLERKREAHSYAILKEFQEAERGGKLDEYMEWWRQYYQKDIENVNSLPEEEINRISKNYGAKSGREAITQLIRQNLALRESIYRKIVSKRQKKQ